MFDGHPMSRSRRRRDGQMAPAPAPGEGSPQGAASPAQRADVLERLLDLAYDVSSYLRHQSRPVIRVSAALLVAASLAACSAQGPSSGATPGALTQEVRNGLPTRPGSYSIVDGSLARDSRGVYHFSWLEPGATGAGTPASASLIRLNQAEANRLEVPTSGDPILHLRQDAPVALASTVSSTPGTTYRSGSYVHWYPFPIGGSYYVGPSYYDPPSRTISTSGTVSGSNASAQPAPPSQRTFGVSSAVSGQAGGTGSGTAATSKSGADVGGKGATVGSVGGKGSVAPAKSSGFSSGSSSSSSSKGSSGSSSSSASSSGG